jgi:protein-S-isoprenylcysteine O-methyltransferase Ste14
LYARIRHPIYALGVVLMTATMVVAPSPAMLLVGISHIILVLLKVESEEQFLIQEHGQLYDDYCKRSGRYFPRPLKFGRSTTT